MLRCAIYDDGESARSGSLAKRRGLRSLLADRERRAHERQRDTAQRALSASQTAADGAERLAATADDLRALAPRLDATERQRVVRALLGGERAVMGRASVEARVCLASASFSSDAASTYDLSIRKKLTIRAR